MDLAAIIADAQIVIALGKLAISVGQDAAPFVMQAYEILINGKTLSDQERQALSEKEAALRAQLQEPLPDGETDDAGQ